MNDTILILIVVAQFALIASLHYFMYVQRERLKTWRKDLLENDLAFMKAMYKIIENETTTNQDLLIQIQDIEDRMTKHQMVNGFETIFDIISDDLSELKGMIRKL